jgi:hypothetical protein
MRNKDQVFLEEAYLNILENKYERNIFNKVDFKTQNDDRNAGLDKDERMMSKTGIYAVKGPNPNKKGSSGYWDSDTGEFLYGVNDNTKYKTQHHTQDFNKAREMANRLSDERKDLEDEWKNANSVTMQYDPEYKPFHVVEIL